MDLYLVRHGKARKGGEDRARPLTDRGRRDVRAVGAFLKGLGLRVDQIWHSDRKRAIETAELIGRAVRASRGMVQRRGLGPLDPVGATCRSIGKAPGDLIIVGHLPSLGRIASQLLTGDDTAELLAFPTGAVVKLTRESAGRWQLEWVIAPSLLR